MKQLIKNVRIFDGKTDALTENACIVIEDELVSAVETGSVPEEGFDAVIDGRGMTAMPGMCDSHAHLGLSAQGSAIKNMRVDEIAIRSTVFAREMLERGFTTVRDAGGLTCGLKATIDAGVIPGPRIFPSNACISQTCGHADMRSSRAEYRLPDGTYLSPFMNAGEMVLADGVSEVMRAVRDQLFLGASQIKIMAGGGLSSPFDHLFTTQYTFEEVKAAVDCAEDYGTYVMAHIYTPRCMQRAAKAGVKSFEHATLMDEETARVIADNGIWVCPCPQFGSAVKRAGSSTPPKVSGYQMPIEAMIAAENFSTEMIDKYDICILFGTDASDSPQYVEYRQHNDISLYKKRFGSYRTLKSLTGNVNELVKLCTYQNPYAGGKLGVLEKDAWADILLVDGNPLADADVLANKDNIRLVMKGGKVYKDNI